MNPNMQMAIGRSMQSAQVSESSLAMLQQCWMICGDRHLTREDLTSPHGVPDAVVQSVSACCRKCVARQFEVLELMTNTRELREKEMIQGLAPGTLTSELV